MKAKIITLENKAAGNIELPDAVFGVDVRKDILARMVNFQRAKKRAGTHKVKTRGEIRGTTAKPFRQKGSGRARQGSIKVVQMRGGATVFGPVVRDHGHRDVSAPASACHNPARFPVREHALAASETDKLRPALAHHRGVAVRFSS